jgi:uncharacterized protein DUF5317
MLLLYFVAAGLLIGRALGGRLAGIADATIAWWPLAVLGLLAQVVLFAGPVASRVGSAGPVLYVASTVAVLAALLRNLSLPGFPVIAAGAAFNLCAIVANGGYMPSSPSAWVALNGVAALPTADYSNSTLAGAGSPLAFLGDVFALPRPLPFANVFSIGDLLIGLGGMLFLVSAMRGGRHDSPLPAVQSPTPAAATGGDR